MTSYDIRNVQVFNTPTEAGLRAAIILSCLRAKSCSLQRLIFYDYLLVHSNDVHGGPPSLHPPIPYRSCEILVKREIMQKGLFFLQSKQLIDVHFGNDGIEYKATKITVPFLNFFASAYAHALKRNADWVISTFEMKSDEELEVYIKQNLDCWGGEFARESVVRGVFNE